MLLCPDTGPLLILARIGRLDLLGENVVLVDAVVTEAKAKSDEASNKIERMVADRGVVTVLPSERFPARLGLGERAILTWAEHRRDTVVCVLDDKAARRSAKNLRIPFTGTLGLLLKAKAEGKTILLRPLLEQAVGEGLYLDKETIAKALSRVGE